MAIFIFIAVNLKKESIKTTADISSLKERFFNHQGPITSADLYSFYKEQEPGVKSSTINWRMYDLVNKDVLKRIGRGLFLLGKEIPYENNPSTKLIKLSTYISRAFPYIRYCVWDSSALNEFSQHISGHNFFLIDVERNGAESVYYALKDEFRPVFFRLDERQFSDMVIDFDRPLIVRNLVTESPINRSRKGSYPTLEKLLVDFFCDPEFKFLQGSELLVVYENAFSKYTVNQTKLLRYAARKGKKAEIESYIKKL